MSGSGRRLIFLTKYEAHDAYRCRVLTHKFGKSWNELLKNGLAYWPARKIKKSKIPCEGMHDCQFEPHIRDAKVEKWRN
jgi:hypothetical protein